MAINHYKINVILMALKSILPACTGAHMEINQCTCSDNIIYHVPSLCLRKTILDIMIF